MKRTIEAALRPLFIPSLLTLGLAHSAQAAEQL